MAELEQNFEERDMSESPENPENTSEIPETENLQPDEDADNSQPDEDADNSQPDEDADNLQPDEDADNPQPDEDADNPQPENDAEHEEKQEHNDTTQGGGENKWPGWPGESVFRLLVPIQKVGGIIGRKGEFIKKMCEETRARIKILDGPPGIHERAVMVSAKEEPDASLPPAVDALLQVLKRAVDGLDGDAPPVMGTKVSTRLMAPAAQAGSLIGKQGATVKSIQEASGCIVRVLSTDDLPLFALQDDRIVEVIGEPAGVQKAVELIASHLRRFLVDRSVIPMFEMQMQMPKPQMERHMPHQSWGPPPHQAFPLHAGGGQGYEGNHHYMQPSRQVDNYYPPPEMAPPMEKQPHHGISAYGREAPPSMHAQSNAQPAPSMITQVTHQMQIPLSYADAVIGTGGSSISYIRRASGATVTIQETRGVPTEMTAEISGTASQVQTAEQLIQNSMAEAAAAAAGSTQAQAAAAPTDQSYNPYGAQHGSVYEAPPSTTAQTGVYGQATSAYGQATSAYGQNPGAYGSVYGGNYGY